MLSNLKLIKGSIIVRSKFKAELRGGNVFSHEVGLVPTMHGSTAPFEQKATHPIL